VEINQNNPQKKTCLELLRCTNIVLADMEPPPHGLMKYLFLGDLTDKCDELISAYHYVSSLNSRNLMS